MSCLLNELVHIDSSSINLHRITIRQHNAKRECREPPALDAAVAAALTTALVAAHVGSDGRGCGRLHGTVQWQRRRPFLSHILTRQLYIRSDPAACLASTELRGHHHALPTLVASDDMYSSSLYHTTLSAPRHRYGGASLVPPDHVAPDQAGCPPSTHKCQSVRIVLASDIKQ